MTLTRSKFSDVFAMAPDLGAYAFWPVLPPAQDPQLYASRNDRPQPFHLIHEHDAVLVQFSGRGVVEFPVGPVRWHDLEPGDHVYLPAGLPYRVVASEPCLQVLIKADPAGLEAAVWYCQGCGDVLTRAEFDTDAEELHRALFRVSSEFNASLVDRTCARCGAIHPAVDLSTFRWLDIAELIENPPPQPAAQAWG